MERYRHLNQFYIEKYGQRVLKICIDGGFTCPNRDGTCGRGGCIFCGERGAGEHLLGMKEITEQVKIFLTSYRGQRADRFIAYFQNFSNTYDTVENLKMKYDAALIDDRIVGLSIATRPDCINAEIVRLLTSYQEKYDVTVELGLQTANEKTGRRIHRGYTTEQFIEAVQLLRKNQVEVVAHVMIGLPR